MNTQTQPLPRVSGATVLGAAGAVLFSGLLLAFTVRRSS
jgi:hypothetical protein